MHFWLVKESIVAKMQVFSGRWMWRFIAWIGVSTALTVICFTEYFIPPNSTHDDRVFGWGYRAYVVVAISLYLFLIVDAARTLRKLDGVRRAELQVWLLGGCSVAVAVLALMGLRLLTGDSTYFGLQPLMILVFYIGTAVAITTYRIFDARQIVLVAIKGGSLLLIVVTASYFVFGVVMIILPEMLSFSISVALALILSALVSSRIDRVFHVYRQADVARQAAFDISQRESRRDNLERSFYAVLKGWGQSEEAIIVTGAGGIMKFGSSEISERDPVFQAIKQLRWVTPERLSRERSNPERDALMRLLAVNRLGVLVIAEGPSFTALVGVGAAASRRPYTYPQVMELMELASIMESALERAHFSAKVQRTEQLATVGLVGASLAHEIRNPLVSIKTFVQLLPTHHQDPVFREKFFRLIGDEVKRIDQLTEQLLDLSAPRNYKPERIELHQVLQGGLDLVAAKAAEKKVQFQTEFRAKPDAVSTDPAAAKQVMLNLCFNAIQAVEMGANDARWIRISTRNVDGGVEMAVSDNGPGIAPEMHAKLFQPFQTTKSTGFGLGLAICRDILANLQASISVDPPVPGKGATFRVTYPCQAS